VFTRPLKQLIAAKGAYFLNLLHEEKNKNIFAETVEKFFKICYTICSGLILRIIMRKKESDST